MVSDYLMLMHRQIKSPYVDMPRCQMLIECQRTQQADKEMRHMMERVEYEQIFDCPPYEEIQRHGGDDS